MMKIIRKACEIIGYLFMIMFMFFIIGGLLIGLGILNRVVICCIFYITGILFGTVFRLVKFEECDKK